MLDGIKFRVFAFLLVVSSSLQADWVQLENINGSFIEAQIVARRGGEVTLQRKSDRKIFIIQTSSLSEESQKLVDAWREDAEEDEDQDEEDSGNMAKGLYPRTKDEIKSRIKAILDTTPQNGVSKNQQKVVNELNVYRFLCGVSSDTVATPKKVQEATAAALACEKEGRLSHDIGHFTNVCNLSTMKNSLASVSQYISDDGDNNREKRGHRRWCLNPEMKETGFGEGKAGYSAMWSLDTSGKTSRRSWAYLGKGLFPHDRLHGNAWSLYLTENAPAKDKLEIEVWKLRKRPDKAYGFNDDIEGKALPVAYIGIWGNAINFEPDAEQVKKGIYWVRIRGGGVREGYLVELY